MDVQTITMDPEAAREQLAEYSAALRRRTDDEYAAVKAGLEALAAGEAILNLGDAIRGGGLDEKGRPRLAVARADRRQVRYTMSWRSVAVFDGRAGLQGPTSETLDLRVDLRLTEHSGTYSNGYALVPLVPPLGLQIAGGHAGLRKHFVLWEVEQWSDTPIGARPDRDPYLLRHVAGELYAVAFEWDLTDLERAVMAGRRLA